MVLQRHHRLYLYDDDDAYRWLRALAVCAQPDWALTLAVGRAIGVQVTHDRLLRLTRIPWLSANSAVANSFRRSTTKVSLRSGRRTLSFLLLN